MKYLILDTSRNQYWKKNNYGYTSNVSEAKVFSQEEMEEKVNAPMVTDLVAIPIEETTNSQITQATT